MDNPMHDLSGLSDVPTITIENDKYEPSTIEVDEGSIIKITNNDPEDHTITAEKGVFDLEISAGNESEFVPPSEKGTYSFSCRYHPEMTGELIVR